MFNNLIESTSNAKENAKHGTYFGITTVIYGAMFLGFMVWSLFSFDLSSANAESDLALDTLVAPALVPETNVPPPPPKAIQSQKTVTNQRAPQNFDVLRDPVVNINNSTKPPKGITAGKIDFDEVRANIPYKVGGIKQLAEGIGDENARVRGTNLNPSAAIAKKTNEADELDAPPPIPPKPKTVEPAPKKAALVTKGVVNSIARNLPKPPYPIAAKAVRASGAVNVQVTIDEKGNVISAAVTDGHPLLRAAAKEAAQRAKFTPTYLSGEAVKVTGVIVYNFVP
ncbi:MAG TPA: TonB family protein [Pyrinomonadaceae bacterium]|nr:TonB family protein [Pyrinomonadaceae bacterium]